MLHHVTLRCVTLCHATLSRVMLCYVTFTWRYVTLRCVMLCYVVMFCYTLLDVTLCYVKCYVMLCYVMLCCYATGVRFLSSCKTLFIFSTPVDDNWGVTWFRLQVSSWASLITLLLHMSFDRCPCWFARKVVMLFACFHFCFFRRNAARTSLFLTTWSMKMNKPWKR